MSNADLEHAQLLGEHCPTLQAAACHPGSAVIPESSKGHSLFCQARCIRTVECDRANEFCKQIRNILPPKSKKAHEVLCLSLGCGISRMHQVNLYLTKNTQTWPTPLDPQSFSEVEGLNFLLELFPTLRHTDVLQISLEQLLLLAHYIQSVYHQCGGPV